MPVSIDDDEPEEKVVAKLIVSEFVTLDGRIEAPGGEPTHPHRGWVGDFIGEEQMEYKLAEVREAESLLIGRTTYDGFSAAWPERDGEFADKMNRMPKYVVSSTLRDPAWNNTTVLGGDVAAEVQQLKADTAGPILVAGSGTLVGGLHVNGLVDEYRLMVFPVTIGSGLRLFPETPDKSTLRLSDTRVFGSGVVVLTYVTSA